MQFVESTFLFYFLPLALLVHRFAISFNKGRVYGSPARAAIFITTLVFYGYKEPLWLVPFGSCIVFDFIWARSLAQSENSTHRLILLWCSITQNLILLGFFKYYHFILDNLALIESLAPWAMQMKSEARVVLPPGISFYTFESLSFVIDIYRRKIEPPKSALQFFAFIGMFPRFIAGPIVRYREMVGQFTNYTGMRWESGVSFFAIGFFLKRIIADTFSLWVPLAFHQKDPGAAFAWMGSLSYAFQIYFDFFGYSLMAVGLGQILGFDFPQNFNCPYSSSSVRDFWRRWHISLSSWLRDYVYIPLGGNQKGVLRTYLNIGITMLVGGIWHGANWTFVIWGALHGVALIIERRFNTSFGRLGTFVWVVLAWVFFRSETVSQALNVFSSLFGKYPSPGPFTANHWTCLILCLCAFCYVLYFEARLVSAKPKVLRWLESQVAWGYVLLRLPGAL